MIDDRVNRLVEESAAVNEDPSRWLLGTTASARYEFHHVVGKWSLLDIVMAIGARFLRHTRDAEHRMYCMELRLDALEKEGSNGN